MRPRPDSAYEELFTARFLTATKSAAVRNDDHMCSFESAEVVPRARCAFVVKRYSK